MDILKLLATEAKKAYNFEQIGLTIGQRHIAASLNGNIGLCATLGINCANAKPNPNSLREIPNRIALNAAINACLNYSEEPSGLGDIFDAIDFKQYHSICMIGYFGSLVQKFSSSGINLNIFDLDRNDVPTIPMELQAQYLRQSDCVIATATTISNGTFDGILSQTPNSSHVYILGPSTPFTSLMFKIPQIRGLFGVRFRPNDTITLKAIANNVHYGDFKRNGQKVFLLNNL